MEEDRPASPEAQNKDIIPPQTDGNPNPTCPLPILHYPITCHLLEQQAPPGPMSPAMPKTQLEGSEQDANGSADKQPGCSTSAPTVPEATATGKVPYMLDRSDRTLIAMLNTL